MQLLNIDIIPNQKFSCTLDGNFYDIAIKETNNCMSCDVSRNNEIIISGSRITANEFLLPYEYLENEMGNFFMLCQNNDIPYFDMFGRSQFLYFLSNDEVREVRAGI